MFKRKIEQELKEWKDTKNSIKKAFVIKGLRQVGKTFIARKFAEENYKNVIYLNFKYDLDAKKCFDGNLLVDTIIMNITGIMPNATLEAYKTVIILDEIQECSGARAAIKPFVEDGRFDIIATGSLLGIKGYNSKYRGGVSVGYEHTVYMKPMDFEEFLWAKGIDNNVIEYLYECFNEKTKISSAIHSSMIQYFKEYICVGGMPAVVKVFMETSNMNLVLKEQRDILESYKDDFAKHLDENEQERIDKALLAKINKVFNSIPSQLAKENKKFMISKIDRSSSIDKYEEAITWLIDYGLITLCFNLHVLEFPLEANKIDNIFKVYMCDTGLLTAMLDDGTAGDILLNNMGIYKGAIYENIVADAFSKNNRLLYYFSKPSGLEIDFITKYERELTLVEVKATSGNTKSANEVLTNKIKYPEVSRLIRIKDSNIGYVSNILTIPYYLTFLIK